MSISKKTNQYIVKKKHDFIVSVLARLLIPLTGLILMPIYLKYLTKEEYGQWLIMLGITNYLLLANMGIAQTVANHVAKNWWNRFKHERISQFVSTALVIYLTIILSLILIIVVSQIAYLNVSDLRNTILISIMAVCALMAMPFQLFSVSLQSVEHIYEEQIFQIIASMFKLIIFYILLVNGFKLIFLIFANAFTTILPRALSWIRLKIACPTLNISIFKFDKRLTKHVFSNSFGFFIIQIASLLAFNTDNVVIGYFLGEERVPEFALPAQIFIAIQGVIIIISAIYNPTIAKLYKQDNYVKLQNLFIILTYILLQLGILVSIIMGVFGKEFFNFLIDKSIYPGDQVFFALLAFMLISLSIQTADAVIMTTSNHKTLTFVVIFEGAFNLILSIWWIHIWGIFGVILATIIARIPSVIYIQFKSCSIVKMPWWRLCNVILVSVLPLVFIYLFTLTSSGALWRENIFFSLLIFLGIYITTLVTFSKKYLRDSIAHLRGHLT